MTMTRDQIRSFIRHKATGRVGVIIANDTCGGVFRGHADCWFGDVLYDGQPVVVQECMDHYEEFPAPASI